MRDRRAANPRLALAMRRAMLVLVLGAGCAGPPAEDGSTVEQADAIGFTCLNAVAPHVVSCQGTISIFGVTVLDAYLHDLAIELTRDDITVCAAVSGTQVCN